MNLALITVPAFGQANKKERWNLSQDKQEKITDGGRQAYEKVTG
jgi:hypothetical protein